MLNCQVSVSHGRLVLTAPILRCCCLYCVLLLFDKCCIESAVLGLKSDLDYQLTSFSDLTLLVRSFGL